MALKILSAMLMKCDARWHKRRQAAETVTEEPKKKRSRLGDMTVRETIVEETLSSAAAIVTVFQTTKLKKRGKEKTFIGPGRIGFEENMKRKSGGTRKNKNGGGRVHSFERYKRRVSTILSFSLVVSSQILSTLQQSSSAATSLHYSFFLLFIRLEPLCTCRGRA